MSNDSETAPFLTPDRFASLAVGSWMNMVLFTLTCLQAARYYRSPARRTDSAVLKLGVAVNLLADLAGTAACCALTFVYLVTSWGNAEAVGTRHWSLPVVIFTVGVATAVSQFFMISRYWRMTKQHLVFFLLFIILVGAVAGTFGTGVLMVLSPNPRGMLQDVFLCLALIASSAGTFLISLLLFWQRCKSNGNDDTKVAKWYWPHRIISALIETGTVTAAVTIAGTALTLSSVRDTMIWIAFAFIQARVYSCTMLFVLLGRPESASALREKPVGERTSEGPAIPMTQAAAPPATITIMDDAHAFRLTRKRIELHNREPDSDSDSDSDVSRNLNNELRRMGERGLSPRSSVSSEGSVARPDVLSRSASPSEYLMSPSPELRSRAMSPETYPISPLNLSPRSQSPV